MAQQISLLPHPRSILFFFASPLPPSEVLDTQLEPPEEHIRRFKVATVLAGKLFDRLPLNHSSRTPALLSSIPPPPVADSTTPRLFVSLFLFPSFSSARLFLSEPFC